MSSTTVETKAPQGAASEGESNPLMTQRQILLVIFGLMAGMFLSSLDQTIVSTSIRTIGDDLNGLEQQAWVTTAYMITSTITTPIYGKLSDLFGRRPLYLFGIFVFILGSLLSSFSTSMIMLAAFRGVQGIGAGALMSLPMAIMGDILAPRDRAKYQGYFLSVFGVSSVLGPLIGGMFAGANEILWVTGWRWVFLINVPIGIIAFAMVWTFLHIPNQGKNKEKPHVDWGGAVAVMVALVPLLLVAEQGREWGWGSAAAITCYVIAALGLIVFLAIESKQGADAIIPLKLFRTGSFSMATLLGFLVGFGMFGAMMTIPLFLQIVMGLTPTEAGFATLPMTAGIMISSIVSGIVVSKTGKYQIFPIFGLFLMGIAYFYLTFMNADREIWFLMLGMFGIGLGLGQLMQSLTLAAQNAVKPYYMGVATSAATFFRQIGGTLGTAVLLSVLFTVMPTNIQNSMSDEEELSSALDAALTPAVATAPANAGVIEQMWNPIVDPIKQQVEVQMAPTGQPVDWSNDEFRSQVVEQVAPEISSQIQEQEASSDSSNEGSANISDTSYLNGADPRLTRPFMVGFSNSAVSVFWVGFAVICLAFVLSLFFRVPPLRQRSGIQESADAPRTGMINAIGPATGSFPVIGHDVADSPIAGAEQKATVAVDSELQDDAVPAPAQTPGVAPTRLRKTQSASERKAWLGVAGASVAAGLSAVIVSALRKRK